MISAERRLNGGVRALAGPDAEVSEGDAEFMREDVGLFSLFSEFEISGLTWRADV